MDLIKQKIVELLVCPITKKSLKISGEQISCDQSSFHGEIHSGVAMMLENPPISYFDDKFEVMLDVHSQDSGDWKFGYDQQVKLIQELMLNSRIAVDVGCGPRTPYKKCSSSFLIGLEYSLPSIAANKSVDLKVCASATALPLADQSMDLVVAVYSIHHMTGANKDETTGIVKNALSEFSRVIKPGGRILIIEMMPKFPFSIIQNLTWNFFKKLLGASLDQYFWSPKVLSKECNGKMRGYNFSLIKFNTSPFTFIRPIFSIPWLLIPRFLYPLRPVGYLWQA